MPRQASASDGPAESREGSAGLRELRRQQRIELSREHILDTAEVLFAERGYHDTGLKEVAARCEFSVGSIYAFFQNKEKLFETVLMRRVQPLGEVVRRCAPDSMAGDERLVEVARMQIEHMRAHPAWNTIAVDTAWIRGGVVPEVYRDYLHRSMAFLRGIVEQGQREGNVREGDSETLARLFYKILTAYISAHGLFGSDEEPVADPELYLDFIRKSFSTRY